MSTKYMDEIVRLRGELTEARSFAEDAAKKYNELLASNRVTCAYCGHQYDDGTPEAKSAALTAHIAQCEAHPMRQLGASLCALMSLPFPPSEQSLKEMRLGIAVAGMQQGTGEDVRRAFAALDALRVFLPNTPLIPTQHQPGDGQEELC
jgi:hypothetical protein